MFIINYQISLNECEKLLFVLHTHARTHAYARTHAHERTHARTHARTHTKHTHANA